MLGVQQQNRTHAISPPPPTPTSKRATRASLRNQNQHVPPTVKVQTVSKSSARSSASVTPSPDTEVLQHNGEDVAAWPEIPREDGDEEGADEDLGEGEGDGDFHDVEEGLVNGEDTGKIINGDVVAEETPAAELKGESLENGALEETTQTGADESATIDEITAEDDRQFVDAKLDLERNMAELSELLQMGTGQTMEEVHPQISEVDVPTVVEQQNAAEEETSPTHDVSAVVVEEIAADTSIPPVEEPVPEEQVVEEEVSQPEDIAEPSPHNLVEEVVGDIPDPVVVVGGDEMDVIMQEETAISVEPEASGDLPEPTPEIQAIDIPSEDPAEAPAVLERQKSTPLSDLSPASSHLVVEEEIAGSNSADKNETTIEVYNDDKDGEDVIPSHPVEIENPDPPNISSDSEVQFGSYPPAPYPPAPAASSSTLTLASAPSDSTSDHLDEQQPSASLKPLEESKEAQAPSAPTPTPTPASANPSISSPNSTSNVDLIDQALDASSPLTPTSPLSTLPPSESIPPTSQQPSPSSTTSKLPSVPPTPLNVTNTPTAGPSTEPPAAPAVNGANSSSLPSGVSSSEASGSGSVPPSPAKGSANQKILTVLEVNAELFKVCVAFQSQNISMNSPEAGPFAKRLSENLTWLATHVDHLKNSSIEIPFLETDPPVVTLSNPHSVSLDHLTALYAQLRTLFAKDIARRERKAALQRASVPPSASVGAPPASAVGPPPSTPALPPPGTPGPSMQIQQVHSRPISRAASTSSLSSSVPPQTPGASTSGSGIGVKRERPESRGRESHSPSSAKRQNTGEGSVRGTPPPHMHQQHLQHGAMLPPATPVDQHHQTHHQQQQRPGSAMGGNATMHMGAGMGVANSMMMSRSTSGSGSMHGGFPGQSPQQQSMSGFPSNDAMATGLMTPSNSGNMASMQSLSNMPGMGGMPALSNLQGPEAQAAAMRARQMQLRQAQIMANQQQQQHGLQNQAHGQGQTSQTAIQHTPNPQLLAQMQANAARQMSPPQSVGGMGSGQQQTPLGVPAQSGSIPGSTSSATPSVSGVNPQILQQIAQHGPTAIGYFQALQNPSNPMVRYLNQSVPGFAQMPVMQQLQQMQITSQAFQMRNAQQQGAQRNPMMANQMMANQMRQNATASGSAPPQMQQQQQQAQGSQMGMGQQMQSPPADSSMQFTSQQNTPSRPTTSMMGANMGANIMSLPAGMPSMQNLANMPPQQRQMYMAQMQQMQQMQQAQQQMRVSQAAGGGTGGNVNPAMMNPQMLAVAQQQQRQQHEQQQRLAMAQRQGSPLNPGSSAGVPGGNSMPGMDPSHQYPAGLRSNPSMPGIARSGRSPSVAELGTPRLGGRMLPGQGGQSEEYHRALMQAQQQAQRNAQMQQGFNMQGAHGQWPNQGASQPQMQSFGNVGQAGMPYGGTNSPNTLGPTSWPQQSAPQPYPHAASPAASVHQSEHAGTPRQTSATPAPMSHHSPSTQTSEFDSMVNWSAT